MWDKIYNKNEKFYIVVYDIINKSQEFKSLLNVFAQKQEFE